MGVPSAENSPGSRYGAVSFIDDERLFLFGGFGFGFQVSPLN
jgi:hypothetical protein